MTDTDLQAQLAEARRLLEEARRLLEAYATEITYQLDSGAHDDEALALWEQDDDQVATTLAGIETWLCGQPPARPLVVVEVHDGVAEIVEAPESVQVAIRDFDTNVECPQCGDTLYEDGAQLFCTCGYEGQADSAED